MLRDAAAEAVNLFIIISGFVIANMLVTRREPWRAYILRRGFRLFPLYILLLPISAAAMYLSLDAVNLLPWAGASEATYDDTLRATVASVEAHPAAHWLLHVFLLQGVISDDLLSHSQLAFLAPAWSLSLEWQFYLLAPLIILPLHRRGGWTMFAVLVLASVFLYRAGVFGSFKMPSLLFASAHYFALGIASRLGLAWIAKAGAAPPALSVGMLGLGLLLSEALAILAWAAFLVYMVNAQAWAGSAHRWATWLGRIAFESPLARAQGARSYTVYLVHWPIVQVATYALFSQRVFNQMEALVLLAVIVVPATLVAAQVLYATVELPGIALGAKLARWAARPPLSPKAASIDAP